MRSRVIQYGILFSEPAFGRFCRLEAWLLLICTTVLVGCENDIAKVKELAVLETVSSETGRDVEIVYTEMGKTKARIVAPAMVRNHGDDPNTEFPEGVTIYNYNDSMTLDSKLTANYGISYENKEEILMRDDVVLVNTQGEKLNSEELIWSRKRKKVYSNKFVKMTTPEEIIIGEGFEAEEDFSEYTILKITGRFSVDADEVE